MADNTVLNAGAGGDTIATDDVAGVKYQQVKLVDGTLDSAVPIPGGANGLRVDPSNVTSPTDPVDRAARDMGKVDVASLDQYTPQDVDTGAPVVNALPVVLKKAAAGVTSYLGKVKKAPGDLVADTKFRVKESLKTTGRKFGIGGKEGLPPSFIKEYRNMRKEQGEHPLDVIKRKTSDGYMNIRRKK